MVLGNSLRLGAHRSNLHDGKQESLIRDLPLLIQRAGGDHLVDLARYLIVDILNPRLAEIPGV